MLDLKNPWHGVSPLTPDVDVFRCIIEITKGSRAKYELDKDSGLLKLDRVLYASTFYPANYGFIPQSYCGDGDPLDILVLTDIEILPLTLVRARPIGVMQMLDEGADDDKIIAVAADDPFYGHIHEMEQLGDHFLTALRSFFEDYKKLENKEVKIAEFGNRGEALKIVNESFLLYQSTFQ